MNCSIQRLAKCHMTLLFPRPLSRLASQRQSFLVQHIWCQALLHLYFPLTYTIHRLDRKSGLQSYHYGNACFKFAKEFRCFWLFHNQVYPNHPR